MHQTFKVNSLFQWFKLRVVDPRYEPQNGVYETEYNGFEIAVGVETLIRSFAGSNA